MYQERIHALQRRTSPNDSERANYRYSASRKGKRTGKQFLLYVITPPATKPFLPSDEAIRELVGTIPQIRLHDILRYPDRDAFIVRGLRNNIFVTRTTGADRTIRTSFLYDVGAIAMAERTTPSHVIDACELFLTECGFMNVVWDGVQLVAYDRERHRYEGRRITGGIYWKPFRTLLHTCKPMLPFAFGTFEAAQY